MQVICLENFCRFAENFSTLVSHIQNKNSKRSTAFKLSYSKSPALYCTVKLSSQSYYVLDVYVLYNTNSIV